jgi:hypothetical protein
MAPRVRRVLVSAWILVAAAALLAQSPTASQKDPLPTGMLVGQTLDGMTGKGLAGVIVTLANAPVPTGSPFTATPPPKLGRLPMKLLTDANGRFVFREVPKGSFTITASKPGYDFGPYGRRAPTDTVPETIVLGDGEKRGDLSVPLWKFGAISGTVVDETGEPLINVQVKVLRRTIVSGRPRFQQIGATVSTDDRGVYRAASLGPGDYVVGIVTTQTTVPVTLVTAFAAAVKNGRTEDIQRDLDRSSSQSFSLFGGGQPVGSWLLRPASGSAAPPPPAQGKVYVYPCVFYPTAGSIGDATIVTLAPAADRTGIDFQLRPVVASTVSGVLTGLNGPEAQTALDLVAGNANDPQRDYEIVTATTVSDSNGAFAFLGVTPGLYTIRVQKMPLRPQPPPGNVTVIQTGSSMIMSGTGPSVPPPIPDGPTLWANASVSVEERDVNGVSVMLATGARVGGHVEFEGATDRPAPDRLRLGTVTIDPADGRNASPGASGINQFTLSRAVIDTRGQLSSYEMPPGRYVVRASGPWQGWWFKGAFEDGRDVSDAPFEIGGKDVPDLVVVFTDKPTELAGATRNSKGVDSTATVLVFPEQASLWRDQGPAPRRLKTARVGSDGKYKLTALPAGDYLVVAVSTAAPDWMDVKSLQKLSALATRVTIADARRNRSISRRRRFDERERPHVRRRGARRTLDRGPRATGAGARRERAGDGGQRCARRYGRQRPQRPSATPCFGVDLWRRERIASDGRHR